MSEEPKPDPKEEETKQRQELLQIILTTLFENSSSFVVMIQVSPETQGQCHWGGNYEACENMSRRVEQEFQETLEAYTEEEPDEDEEWKDSE